MKTLSLAVLALTFANNTSAQCNLNVGLQVTQPDCGEVANGSVVMSASGGATPYTYYWNGSVSSASVSGLTAGTYDYWVQDAVNCWFKGSLDLACKVVVNCHARTQTQGGWGATPNGNNPAMYLQNHWTSCFPNGITIGCASNNTLTLTSSTAVKNFLPSGSTPAMLDHDRVNPGGTYNNVLAGQLVAAVINVTVDACDPDFAPATGWLGDFTYASGAFAGQSVASVIDAANQFIGGCGGSYTAAQFNTALTNFNENYDNGSANNGYLVCPKGDKKDMEAPDQGFNAYPNPASTEVNMTLQADNAGSGMLYLHDITGRIVAEQTVTAPEAGARKFSVNVAQLPAGTYTAALVFNGRLTTTRVVVAR